MSDSDYNIMIDNMRRLLAYCEEASEMLPELKNKGDLKELRMLIDDPDLSLQDKNQQIHEWIVKTNFGANLR